MAWTRPPLAEPASTLATVWSIVLWDGTSSIISVATCTISTSVTTAENTAASGRVLVVISKQVSEEPVVALQRFIAANGAAGLVHREVEHRR